jgi:hypothetical protein
MAIDQATRATWAEHLRRLKESGLKRQVYCREHGIKDHQLRYWAGRLGDAGAVKANTGKSAFARIVTAAPVATTRTGTARLCFGGGVALELDASSDPTWIAQVIVAVGGGK